MAMRAATVARRASLVDNITANALNQSATSTIIPQNSTATRDAFCRA
jgi:hypothetical protein